MKKKNILDIIKNDFRSLTSSVVTVVMLIGLIVLPCLYAWFNILSNWDPYSEKSTSRVEFAVANEDKGTNMIGLKINVGEKIVDALNANHSIGWTFVRSSREAVDGVTRGDYYAAVVIPKDFSKRTLSFTTGDLKNPELYYYENKKKNAVMPKITGSAKSALQSEVDTAFIETLGKYVTEAGSAAKEAGVDPQEMFGDISEQMDNLGDKTNDCIALVSAAAGLSNSAGDLIEASDRLIGSSQNTLIAGEEMLDKVKDTIPGSYAGDYPVMDSIEQICQAIPSDLSLLSDDLSGAKDDIKAFNRFADQKLEKRKARVRKIKDDVDKVTAMLKALDLTPLADRFEEVSDRLDRICEKLDKLENVSDKTWGYTKKIIDDILNDIDFVQGRIGKIDRIKGSWRARIEKRQKLVRVKEKISEKREGKHSVVASIRQICQRIPSTLTVVSDDLSGAKDNIQAFNRFADQKLEKTKTTVRKMKAAVDKIITVLKDVEMSSLADRFQEISDRLGRISEKLNKLKKANDTNWEDTKRIIDEILDEIGVVQKKTRAIDLDVAGKIDGKIDEAIRETRNTITRTKDSLNTTYGKLGHLSDALSRSEHTLDTLDGGILKTIASLNSVQGSFNQLSKLFGSFANSEELKNINVLLTDGSDVIAENLAAPVKMKEKVIYPTANYGSAVSPFYTTLALWVGALFTAVFIKAEVRRRKENARGADETSEDEAGEEAGADFSVLEKFFGRLRVYLFMGVAQAVLITLGVLFYCGIGCLHPGLFLLAACVTALTYQTINYVLRYLFDEIGLAVSVIMVLLQVAGSGGTYPIHVLPQIFHKLYPFMPFHYSMDALRECVAGMYGNTYIRCLGMLAVFILVFIVLGLLLRKPAHAMNHRIAESLEKCELME